MVSGTARVQPAGDAEPQSGADAGRARTASTFPPDDWGAGNRLGIRLSIGLEDPRDLKADLERAFAAMDGA